ncbi:MAG: mechanosensitive ion channel domain-containing protein [Cyanobacteria bacterium P01_E01_bin.6]
MPNTQPESFFRVRHWATSVRAKWIAEGMDAWVSVSLLCKRLSYQFKHFKQVKHFVCIGIALITLCCVVLPQPAHSQASAIDGVGQASVVIDGEVMFEVRDTGALSAPERAGQINQKLRQELRSPHLAEIFVVQKERLVYLQSRHTDEILTTITEADVLLLQRKPFEQARLWATSLQNALRKGQLERRSSYLRQAVGYSSFVISGAIAIHLLLHFLGKFGNRRFTRWTDNRSHPLVNWEQSLRLFWQLGLLGSQAGLWITVGYYVTDLFPQTRGWRYQFSTARVLDLGNRNYSALDLLFFCLSAIALWIVVSLVARVFRLYVLNQTGIEQRVQDILGVFVQYALVLIGGIILLQIWGIDMSSLTILASVLGVGLGFGVQNITNNFISGFIITLERPVQAGDFINVGELVGTVERIGARSTEIRTLDQVTIIVPNSRFLENEVINWSHGDPVSRLHLPVGVAYGSNIAKVKVALLEAVRRHPEVLLRPKPEVWFQGFGESSLQFDLLVWTGEPRNQFRIKSDLYYEIEASFRRHNIAVPFPQRDLHVRSPQLDNLVTVLSHRLHPADGITLGDQPSEEFDAGHSPSSSSTSPAPGTITSSGTAAHGNGHGTEDRLTDDCVPDSRSADHQTFDQPASANPLPSLEFLANVDFEQLADVMSGEEGVSIGDHHYRFNHYPRCFTGTDAVAWLVQHQGYTREESTLVGQGLLQQGLIKSISDDESFRDGYYFYRFYRDEQWLYRQEAQASLLDDEACDDSPETPHISRKGHQEDV